MKGNAAKSTLNVFIVSKEAGREHFSADVEGSLADSQPYKKRTLKTRQDNHSVKESRQLSSQSITTKSAYRFRSVNISQSETALCTAVLAQSGTDAMVPLVPWPVPGHQRLDARQSPLGASQHAKKKVMRKIVCTSNSNRMLH